MNYAQAIKLYNGKKVDVDYFPKSQPYQCYDWAVKFMQKVYGLRFNPYMAWSGGVKDFYTHFGVIRKGSYRLADKFRLVSYKPGRAPKQGDIVIWSGGMPGSLGFGHIGVVDKADKLRFYSYDQNYGAPYVRRVLHNNYKWVLGWMTPKTAGTIHRSLKPAPKRVYYRVKAGDFLGKIAMRFKVPVTRLLRLNPRVRDKNLIYPNQRLRIR